MNDRNNTFLVGTADGVYASPHVAKMPDDVAYDGELLQTIVVRYYNFIDDGTRPPPAIVAARNIGGAPSPDPAPVPAAGGEYQPRRMKITKADLENHGYTAGCPGCMGAQDGIRRGGHTEECRRRIEEQTMDRRDKAQERISQWMAEKVQADVKEVAQENEAPEKVDGGEVQDDSMGAGIETPKKDDNEMKVVNAPVTPGGPDDLTLQDGPESGRELRRRVASPDRPPPVKRRNDLADDGVDRVRQRVHTPARQLQCQLDEEAMQDDGNGGDRGNQPTRYSIATPPPMAVSDDGGMELSDVDKRILASLILSVDITEVFSPVRVNKLAARFGLTPGASMDLTNGWDFTREADRRRAWKNIKETNPYVVIGSPPCTLFSNLQELNKYVHRDDPAWLSRFEEEKKKASRHIEFCIQLYRHQLRQGIHFLHGHPWGASSWKILSVEELLQDGRVHIVENHQCRFGLESHIHVRGGEQGPVKKPTGFMTSSRCIAMQLDKRCDGTHTHVHLVGGRAATAQTYPEEQCKAIVRGVVRQKAEDREGRVSTPVMDAPQLRSFMGSIGVMMRPQISSTVVEGAAGCKPGGSWPDHWHDPVHELDGGNDSFGNGPNAGSAYLQASSNR